MEIFPTTLGLLHGNYLCTLNLFKCFSAIFDSANLGKDDLALVRRYAGSLDHLHVVLSSIAVGRLYVRGIANSLLQAGATSNNTSSVSDGGDLAVANHT